MKHSVMLMFLLILVSGCRTKQPIVLSTSDSTRVETRYERIVVRDTAYIEIPLQTAEKTVWDSTSTLENEYAVSTARFNSDGSLFHTLRTKPQSMPVPTDRVIERKDSIVYVDKTVEVPVPTERELSRWERTSIRWFPYLCGVLAVAAAWIFRKPLISLIRRFI